jgi:hypothetical protein
LISFFVLLQFVQASTRAPGDDHFDVGAFHAYSSPPRIGHKGDGCIEVRHIGRRDFATEGKLKELEGLRGGQKAGAPFVAIVFQS